MMLLLDKGYFDYDFAKEDRPEPTVNWEDTIKSDEEVNDILSAFGLGKKAPKTTEEIQDYIRKQMEEQ